MRTRTMMMVTAVLTALTLAACGGSTDAPETSVASLSAETDESDGTTANTTPDFEEAQVAFAECMREEGIPMPDPEEGEGFRVEARSDAGGEGDGSAGPDDQGNGEGDGSDDQSPEEGAVDDIGDADSVKVNGVEVDPKEFQAAQEACGHLMEDAIAAREGDPEQRAEMQDQLLEFSQCMRDQGLPWPDPEFDENGGVTMQMSDEIDPESEEVQDAMDACGGPPGPGPREGGPENE